MTEDSSPASATELPPAQARGHRGIRPKLALPSAHTPEGHDGAKSRVGRAVTDEDHRLEATDETMMFQSTVCFFVFF